MNAVAKLSYTHDAMIDLIIAQPAISNNQLAAHFGYTAPWVSMIKSSDAFKARLAERRGEIVDPTLTATLQDRFKAVTERSLEVIAEKLAQPAALIPDALALRAAELGAKSMGLGQQAPTPAGSNLDALAQRLLALQAGMRGQQPTQEIIDVESKEIAGS